MNKEILASQFQHYAKVAKDYIVQEWHRFVDYLAKKKRERENNGSNIILAVQCMKYFVVFISIFYVLLSLFVITFGVSTYLAHERFYDLWFDFQLITIFVMFSGAILTVIAILGMIGALKESVILMKIYGIVLMALFVLQLLISISAFCMIATGSSRYHSFNIINRLMRHYHEDSKLAGDMDWIQDTFNCCGGNDPSEWETIDKIVNGHNYYEFDFDTLSYITPAIPTTEPIKYKTPISCCTKGSGYQNMMHTMKMDVLST